MEPHEPQLAIGDLVGFRGRPFFVRGFSPVDLPEPQIELQDPVTDEWITAPLAEIRPEPAGGASAGVLKARLRRAHRPFGAGRGHVRTEPHRDDSH